MLLFPREGHLQIWIFKAICIYYTLNSTQRRRVSRLKESETPRSAWGRMKTTWQKMKDITCQWVWINIRHKIWTKCWIFKLPHPYKGKTRDFFRMVRNSQPTGRLRKKARNWKGSTLVVALQIQELSQTTSWVWLLLKVLQTLTEVGTLQEIPTRVSGNLVIRAVEHTNLLSLRPAPHFLPCLSSPSVKLDSLRPLKLVRWNRLLPGTLQAQVVTDLSDSLSRTSVWTPYSHQCLKIHQCLQKNLVSETIHKQEIK
jgi:hypothetical protein